MVIKKFNIGVVFCLVISLSLTNARLQILKNINRIQRQTNTGQFNGFDNLGNFEQRQPWSPNQSNNNFNRRPDIVQGTFVGFGPGDTNQNPNSNDFQSNQNNPPNRGNDLVEGTFVGFGAGDTNSDRLNSNRQIQVGAPTTSTVRPRFAPTQSAQYYQCLRLCPQTSEYNPICGSDSQDYHNLSTLNCSANCGLNVSMVKIGPCNPL